MAKAWPVGEAPAFMIRGRTPPYGFGLPRYALHVEMFALEVEILLVGPDHLDDVDPFLGIIVAVAMLAGLSTPNMSNSPSFQPTTMLSPKRPSPM